MAAAETIKLKLSSRIESIDEAVNEALNYASDIGFSEEAFYAIDMAVREAVTNAVKHGNLLDETKFVELTFSSENNRFCVAIRDFGAGFEVEEVPDPTNPENLLKATGRGILFIRTFMDEVEWQKHPEGGMIIKMQKNR